MKKHNTKLLLAGTTLVALTVTLLMLRWHTGQSGTNQASQDESRVHPVLTVRTVQPQTTMWTRKIEASGNIAAWQEAIIAAETGGLRIDALHAEIGQHVKRGQLLAELARASVEADLHRYEAALASAQASLAQAKANASRARLVKGSGALSDQQVADYLATEQTSAASVKEAAAQVAAQRVTLDQTRIVAVDDGIITSKSALLGQVVSAGTELFRLQRQGRIEWQAEVAAQQLGQIHPGAKASVTLPTGQQLDGSVRLVSPSLSTTTSRASVYVTLPPTATAGMFASGQIETGEHEVLSLPEAAVTLRDGISYAFEIDQAGKVIRHRLSTGARQHGQVEILSGLTAGTRVAASGGAFLADGDQVKISQEAP